MFFFSLALYKTGCFFFNDKKRRSFGGHGQKRDKIRISAGGDELLGAVDSVSGNHTGIIVNRVGLGFQCGQVASRTGLCYGISHQGTTFGDGTQPFFFLRVSAANE